MIQALMTRPRRMSGITTGGLGFPDIFSPFAAHSLFPRTCNLKAVKDTIDKING
jgi:hypothetical protein